MQTNYQQRWQNLASTLQNNTLAIVYSGESIYRNNDVDYPFRPNSNFYYLTGFDEPNAALCLIKKSETLHTVFFALPKDAHAEMWNGIRCGYTQAGQNLGVNHAYSIDDIAQIMPLLLAQVDYCAIDMQAMYTQHTLLRDALFTWLQPISNASRLGHKPLIGIIDLAAYIAELRLIKDASELNIMQKAASISAIGHMRAMQKVEAGLQEDQLEAELIYTFKQHKSESIAYNSIVAAGANACILHHRAGKSILKNGDLCLIDAGCELHCYASDITRTFPVNGKFSSAQAEIYDCVFFAQQAAILHAKAGHTFDSVHECALKILVQGMLDMGLLSKSIHTSVEHAIESGAYKTFYPHRTSHWLGLDVHDVGRYKEKIEFTSTYKNTLNTKLNTQIITQFDTSLSTQENLQKFAQKQESITLQAGMVMTIEPGLYIQPQKNVPEKYWNIGVRIEDDVYIQENTCLILSKDVPNARIDIEKLQNSIY
jgi:Xaa-Pro aminopeptidase